MDLHHAESAKAQSDELAAPSSSFNVTVIGRITENANGNWAAAVKFANMNGISVV